MNGFTFFENYYKAISDPDNGLTEEEQGRLYNAIFSYMFDGIEPDLKGACRMAFQLIKPSLDLSKVRSETKKKGQKGAEEGENFDFEKPNETKHESKRNQNESNQDQNETKTNQNETKHELSPFFEKKEIRNKKEEIKDTDGLSAGAREADEIVSDYLSFMHDHPSINEDIQNPDEIAAVDFNVLSDRIKESNFLQTRNSLKWLIGNYAKINSGAYRDFTRTRDAPAEQRDCLTAAELRGERERHYAVLREQAIDRAEQMRKKAEENAEFKKANILVKECELALARAESLGTNDLSPLQYALTQAKDRRKQSLKAMGITESDLLPAYTCKKCSDTGFMKDGRMCDCYAKEKKR